jgi:hypothetical protein
MRVHRLIALSSLALVLSLVGCNRRVITEAPIVLDLAGPVGIDVDTFAGDVWVDTKPDTTQTIVTISRESTHGHDRGDEAMAAMEEIGFTVDVVPGDIGQVVQIRAITMHSEPHFQRVNVHIQVPEVEGVSVHTTRGRVDLFDVRGSIDVSTTDQDVRMFTNYPLVDPVTILNRDAHINVRLRGESRGELDFQTVGGRVHQKIKLGKSTIHPGSDNDTLLATFNEGDNHFVLRTTRGNITFDVVTDATSFAHFLIP